MKNRGFIFTGLMVISLLASSCMIRINSNAFPKVKIKGSSVYTTKTVDIGNFNALNIYGHIDVKYESGDNRVEIYGPENIVDYIKVVENNGTLNLSICDTVYCYGYNSLEIKVFGSNLNSVSLYGSGDLSCNDIDSGSEKFKVMISGSGDIRLSGVKAGDFDARISGSGDIGVKKLICNSLHTATAGSGDIRIERIRATYTEVSIVGSGDVRLSGSSDTAKYKIAGSGDIDASAFDVSKVSTSVAGSGSIKYRQAGKLIVED